MRRAFLRDFTPLYPIRIIVSVTVMPLMNKSRKAAVFFKKNIFRVDIFNDFVFNIHF